MTERLASPRPRPDGPPSGRAPESGPTFGADLGASLVVFLVALPLCVGIAAASGVPLELGIVTGVVGGLVVGLLPGSTMQVSGPAAGLTVLVASTVAEHGLALLGVVVLGAGVLQILMGVTRLGTWFRAVPPSVVQGLLAGIGLVLILGQVYPAVGTDQPDDTPSKFAGLPDLVSSVVTTSTGRSGLAVTALTLVVMAVWPRMPRPARAVPGPLVAVATGTAVTLGVGLPLPDIEVGSLLGALNVPAIGSFGALAGAGVLVSVVTIALIASAESLFSAAAVDRMHDGPKTQYNRELVAQGTGNAICGMLGALPMTAVIVRSSTNVRAGARTKLARVLHGVWLLLFVAFLPGVLSVVPAAVLAAVLLHAGWKLLSLGELVRLTRVHRSEAFVVALTAGTIVATDLMIGTLTGLGVAILKTAWEVSRLSVDVEPADDHLRVRVRGAATFLRLPQLQDRLDTVPHASNVHVDLTPVRHLDRACRQSLDAWAEQRRRADSTVELAMPAGVD